MAGSVVSRICAFGGEVKWASVLVHVLPRRVTVTPKAGVIFLRRTRTVEERLSTFVEVLGRLI